MSSDQTAINQLLASYCHRVDRGEPAQVAELFAADAVLLPRYDGNYRVEGREAIQSWYTFYNDNFKSGVRHLKHLIHSVALDIDGDQATGVCYLTAYLISKADGLVYQVQGTYFDKFVKVGGSWLFRQREINVEFMTECGPAIERLEPLGFDTAES
ncbi:MAG: nuclear transport factor 2 family protein [Gammaproteobacteria bacterium]